MYLSITRTVQGSFDVPSGMGGNKIFKHFQSFKTLKCHWCVFHKYYHEYTWYRKQIKKHKSTIVM